MPISAGVPGFALPLHERVAALVAMVGGPSKAAALIGRSLPHIDNMRKPGAPLRLMDLLPLCVEAGVSLDWIATGYQVRPDIAAKAGSPAVSIAGIAEAADGASPSSNEFVRLSPLQPLLVQQRSVAVERWEPSPVAFGVDWLQQRFGLTLDFARYAYAGDHGMTPLVERGALVIVDTRPANPRPGLYTVKVGDELVVRRLHRLPDGRAELAADAQPAWRFTLPADAGANDNLQLHPVIWVAQPG